MNRLLSRSFTILAAALTLGACTRQKTQPVQDQPETSVRMANVIHARNVDTFYVDTREQAKGFVTIHDADGSKTTYDINAISTFFVESQKTFKADYIGDVAIGGKDILLNGKRAKPHDLPAEAVANLVLKNGIITIGNNPPTSNYSMLNADPDKPGDEPGRVGHVHTHPAASDVTVQLDSRGTFSTTALFNIHGGRPSPGDHGEYDRSGKGLRFVVVDEKNIYFYNGNADQTLKVERPKVVSTSKLTLKI